MGRWRGRKRVEVIWHNDCALLTSSTFMIAISEAKLKLLIHLQFGGFRTDYIASQWAERNQSKLDRILV